MLQNQKLRIGPSYYDFTIERIEDDGASHHGKGYIKISDELSDERVASTTLHEIFHLLMDEYNVKLSTAQEERVVLALESGLCGFAKDHQELFHQIVSDMGGNHGNSQAD
jgi:hypothetical protein